jgi:hypothetical protein
MLRATCRVRCAASSRFQARLLERQLQLVRLRRLERERVEREIRSGRNLDGSMRPRPLV